MDYSMSMTIYKKHKIYPLLMTSDGQTSSSVMTKSIRWPSTSRTLLFHHISDFVLLLSSRNNGLKIKCRKSNQFCHYFHLITKLLSNKDPLKFFKQAAQVNF